MSANSFLAVIVYSELKAVSVGGKLHPLLLWFTRALYSSLFHHIGSNTRDRI